MRFMLGPWRVRRRSKRVVSRVGVALVVGMSSVLGLGLGGVDLMVGGSWRWSPARITFFAGRRGIQHWASRA